ncbi:12036_t:CDS:1 [Funneliformis geosporum]|uniref:8255_t:CDS:1 n=1 Tax=Funneliformis geosporum TaxID=1117311 RepID=A0A9W4T051_9GLOM|nr:12036_t:CDS:1 [Funneliformis geosporum]CAI2187705.1 8255_t:CDS:1 [Funneliformis geosporum]
MLTFTDNISQRIQRQPSKIVITIVGGGNCSHIMAGLFGSNPNYEVRLLTRRPKEWNSQITVEFKLNKPKVIGKIAKISSDPLKVIPGSQWIIISSPVSAHLDILRNIAPFVSPGSYLGTIFAQGGFQYKVKQAFNEVRKNVSDIIVFGCQYIPWACRTKTYGKCAVLLGHKQYLFVAKLPTKCPKASKFYVEMKQLFSIPVRPISNFLSITLTPSNQIIHPARMFGLFGKDFKDDKDNDVLYKREPYFYGELDDRSTDLMQRQSNELQALKNESISRHPDLDLSSVMDLKERIVEMYAAEVGDTSTLRSTIRTNVGWTQLKCPMVPIYSSDKLDSSSPSCPIEPRDKSKGVILKGYKPDFSTRYMWDDIPYGLVVLRSVASLLDVEVPCIDEVLYWGQSVMGKEYLVDGELIGKDIHETGAVSNFGILSPEELFE